MQNLKILAAVVVVALGGCVHEGDPPPPPPILGEWFASHTAGDTELELTIDVEEPARHFIVGDARLQVTEPDELPLVIHGYMSGTYHFPFVDMDFKLFVVAGQDPVEARFRGSLRSHV